MSESTTEQPALSTVDKATQPVRVRNACCPKCGGAIFWCPRRWLFCKRCSAHRRPIPFAVTERRVTR